MPYDTLDDLPEGVKNTLPRHARKIYQQAFNNAWDQYESARDRHGDDDRETVAHKVAWSAVKEKYQRRDGRWQAIDT